MEKKERNATRWRVCREQVKQPVAELTCKQAARDSDRQHVNCRKGLRRCNLRSRRNRGLYGSYALVLTTCALTIGLVTLELHGAAARGCLRLRDRICPAQKEGYKDRHGKRQSHQSGETAHVSPHR